MLAEMEVTGVPLDFWPNYGSLHYVFAARIILGSLHQAGCGSLFPATSCVALFKKVWSVAQWATTGHNKKNLSWLQSCNRFGWKLAVAGFHS
jgi:hypothetical protein